MKRNSTLTHLLFAALTALFLVVPGIAGAQEAQEDSAVVKPGSGLGTSGELRSKKRKALRNGEWVGTAQAAASGGYHSNIHYAPSNGGSKKGSIFGGVAGRVELERRFNGTDTLDMGFEASSLFFAETDNINSHEQDLEINYDHEYADTLSVFVQADAGHVNDSATSILGTKFTRDFSAFSYRGEVGAEWEFIPDYEIALSYFIKRKDYASTPGRSDLDWIDQGIQAHFGWEVLDEVKVRVWYDMSFQNYDNEPANDITGAEVAGYPAEKHRHQKLLFWASYDPTDTLGFDAKYSLRTKTDRFQNFESYKEHGGELSISWSIMEELVWTGGGFFDFRQYDHRETASTPMPLEYKKGGAETALIYQINENLAVFGGYAFEKRNTNRAPVGTSYRDYTVSIFSLGISAAI